MDVSKYTRLIIFALLVPYIEMTFYQIRVLTGNLGWSETNANVHITLIGGEKGKETLKFRLVGDGTGYYKFEKGAVHTYLFHHVKNVFPVTSVVLHRDDSGYSPDWYVDKVMVCCGQRNIEYTVQMNTWIEAATARAVSSSTPREVPLDVYVTTIDHPNAKTGPNIICYLNGESREDGVLVPLMGKFDEGSVTHFTVFVSKKLGLLSSVILVNNNHRNDRWKPEKVVVYNPRTTVEQTFRFNQWIKPGEKASSTETWNLRRIADEDMRREDFSSCVDRGFYSKKWLAEGGNSPGALCRMPFIYKGKCYDDCLYLRRRIWSGLMCSTTADYDKLKKWTTCKTEMTSYQIRVFTGNLDWSETSANTHITLIGGKNGKETLKFRIIGSGTDYKFQKGAVDRYVFYHAKNVFPVKSVALHRDDSGYAPGWYVDKVMVCCGQRNIEYTVQMNAWIEAATTRAVSSSTQRVPLEIQVTTMDEVYSGTGPNVVCYLNGQSKEYGIGVPLSRGYFERGSVRTFIVFVPENLGLLKWVTLANNNVGNFWKPDKVVVYDHRTQMKQTFECKCQIRYNEKSYIYEKDNSRTKSPPKVFVDSIARNPSAVNSMAVLICGAREYPYGVTRIQLVLQEIFRTVTWNVEESKLHVPGSDKMVDVGTDGWKTNFPNSRLEVEVVKRTNDVSLIVRFTVHPIDDGPVACHVEWGEFKRHVEGNLSVSPWSPEVRSFTVPKRATPGEQVRIECRVELGKVNNPAAVSVKGFDNGWEKSAEWKKNRWGYNRYVVSWEKNVTLDDDGSPFTCCVAASCKSASLSLKDVGDRIIQHLQQTIWTM